MTDEPRHSSGEDGGQDKAHSDRFGGTLGSQHKEIQADKPELEQGSSGSSPRPKPETQEIGGQLGGIGGQPRSDGPTAAQPSQSKRKSGCFGLLLAAVGMSAALVGVLTLV